ncbi:tRNA (adenosine(37)-N6)-threonylcarbamoyltransferase complex ATPase subunit type 1 TsaE [Arthrobacter sp. NicSoilB8]|uniref:tRNA (adenosine(37)-N6)-threonylcarbamoyltransferase complex ATPase subunit type 1 TsaE n=1 Tax=Arthrobacter sp. NicSoilB8 TaxID=2830998 RepID=UPI001CC6E944|nr:tRNA (adenosine(37)-N6)-threonylcarbamoyltransferase complex ATPase subunit type 1 TsaE [Arthrobacter sp. NicSoilB8]BCW72254.1 bifunctional tRNA (adenosine(37)-N6)-threonylcarbamoyltransferase complex ATPase subunit type 1 TsaE/phosphotransferase [Arthrobacter sp. NicSoilB8]
MSAPVWERSLEVRTAAETHALAAALGAVLETGDLLVLTGELGAGKTTFTQGLGEGLGVRPGIISPTFVLVRIHPNLPEGPRPGGPDLVHVDAYRLESAAEIDDIDLENTMDSAVTVVEWGRDRVEHLSDSRLEVELHRARGGAVSGAAGVPADPAATPDGDSGVLDFDTDDDDEPRTVVIRGFGPRWAEAPALPGIEPQREPETALEHGTQPLAETRPLPQTPERNS